jgi:hypothetical protein
MHLERIMKPSNTTTAITWSIGLLAVGGAASFLTGLYSGLLLLVAAAALALAQRSSLAGAIRVPDTALRHRGLRTAAALAGVFIASCGVFLATIGDTWTGREAAVALVGTACMIGVGICLLAGLLTPRGAARQV